MSTLTKAFGPSPDIHHWLLWQECSCTPADATSAAQLCRLHLCALPTKGTLPVFPHSLAPTSCKAISAAEGGTGENAQPKLPQGVPLPSPWTLLPPVHLAPGILTLVIQNNLTLKHNSAEGQPPSHKQQMYPVTATSTSYSWSHRSRGDVFCTHPKFQLFFFSPEAYHSPCSMAC